MNPTNLKKWLPMYILIVASTILSGLSCSHAVTVFAKNLPVKRQHTILIDAGHGGIDGGATSCTGVLESTINLQIALRLNDFLQLLGYNTSMTRTTDTSLHTDGSTIAAQKVSDLMQRVRICNEAENGILLSIHQNTFSSSRYSGPQVFWSAEGDSGILAHSLQNRLNSLTGSTRKAKQTQTVYLLRNIRCTGALIECGFLSNPEDEALLRQPSFQIELCCAIAAGLGDFLIRNS